MKSAQPATPVSKEEVRLLAIEIGEKRAAEQLGLNYDTVRQWSHRYQWKRKTLSPQQPVTVVTRQPSTVLLDELAENERETKLSLSRYARKAAKDSESATLKDSPYVKQAAQVAAITHRWDAKEQNQNTVVNVAILGVDPASVKVDTQDTLDVEAQD